MSNQSNVLMMKKSLDGAKNISQYISKLMVLSFSYVSLLCRIGLVIPAVAGMINIMHWLVWIYLIMI